MIIYPAMDLIGGRVVRLQQGRFDEVTAYSAEPAEALARFADAGAEWAHVVDLDGARAGTPVQHELIVELAKSSPLRLQVAGGLRERGELTRLFEAGVARAVVGSLAVKQTETVQEWIDEFGADRIAISLDVRLDPDAPMVAVAGWTEDSGRTLWEVAAAYCGLKHLIVTDIGRDGMLGGPNFALYEELSRRLPKVAVQASGGVSSLTDLERLPTAGAIVGKALWEGRIALEEAIGFASA